MNPATEVTGKTNLLECNKKITNGAESLEPKSNSAKSLGKEKLERKLDVFQKKRRQVAVIQEKLLKDRYRTSLSYDELLDQDWFVKKQTVKFRQSSLESCVTEREIQYRNDPEVSIIQRNEVFDYLNFKDIRNESAQLVEDFRGLPDYSWITEILKPHTDVERKLVKKVEIENVPLPKPRSSTILAAELEDDDLWFAKGYNSYEAPQFRPNRDREPDKWSWSKGLHWVGRRIAQCPTVAAEQASTFRHVVQTRCPCRQLRGNRTRREVSNGRVPARRGVNLFHSTAPRLPRFDPATEGEPGAETIDTISDSIMDAIDDAIDEATDDTNNDNFSL